MTSKGIPYTNRLARATSPYLLQHAHNPVDWYPWGPDAFEKAKRQDKPIFLSVGYSTCHWCHVMAHESFEDERIAAILNEHFVPVKVDREERPDVDAAYMTMVQAMTGSGGWPMSVFLTPEGKPFYGGTYFPPASIAGRPGFHDVLLAIYDAWSRQRDNLLKSSEQFHRQIQSVLSQPTEGQFSEQMLRDAYDMLEQMFDKTYGGFGGAPKFPQPGVLSYLLTYHHRTGVGRALKMVEHTLRQMAAGGIHDHLGGGFHRYSVDAEWFEPHFEKMLYDQAMLSRAFVQAYQVTGNQIDAQQVCSILDYVLRDLTHPSGGFYSAEDADSEGREGLFYLWDFDEVMSELGPEAGPVVSSCYGLTPQGNFKGKNILHIQKNTKQLAAEYKRPQEQIEDILSQARNTLFQRRQKRVRPGRDEKIITAWNGLMIASLAQAGAVLEHPRYIQAAEQAARFILQNLQVEGRLRRSYTMQQVSGPAFLEDYAFLIQGLLDLYEATFDSAWLAESLTLAEQMIGLFEDTQQGGFFFTAVDAEELVVRQKPIYDGPIPSGNSAAAVVLMKLGQFTGDKAYFQRGRNVLQSVSQTLQRQAAGMCNMLMAADFALGPRREMVIAGPHDDSRTQQFMALAHQRFMPRTVVLYHKQGPEAVRIEQINPFIRSQTPVNGKPAVYICENYTCQIPLTSPTEVQAALDNIRPSG